MIWVGPMQSLLMKEGGVSGNIREIDGIMDDVGPIQGRDHRLRSAGGL